MVINQYHSIGDIMFIEPILKHFSKQETVFLPVQDHLFYLVSSMLSHLKDVHVVRKSQFKLDYDSMEHRNPDYLPLRFASQIVNVRDKDDHQDLETMMKDKYLLAGLKPDLWKTIELSGLNTDVISGDYVLVNERSGVGNITINTRAAKNVVKVDDSKRFVLDWAGTISGAKSFHTVSTCFHFMLQAMLNKGMTVPKTYVYPRPNEDGLRGIINLKPDYELIYKH